MTKFDRSFGRSGTTLALSKNWVSSRPSDAAASRRAGTHRDIARDAKPQGTPYFGVTHDLVRRVAEHSTAPNLDTGCIRAVIDAEK
jgi:hypothetical protein